MKVLNSSHINPFGGLNFIIEEFDRLGIGRTLNTELPVLSHLARICNADVMV